MKGLPSTIAGWIVFDLTVIALVVIAAWVFKGEDLPQGVANVTIAIVSGFLGLLTGRAMESQSHRPLSEDPKEPTGG